MQITAASSERVAFERALASTRHCACVYVCGATTVYVCGHVCECYTGFCLHSVVVAVDAIDKSHTNLCQLSQANRTRAHLALDRRTNGTNAVSR